MTINLIMLRVRFGANSTVTSEVFYDPLDQLSKSQVLTHGKFFYLSFFTVLFFVSTFLTTMTAATLTQQTKHTATTTNVLRSGSHVVQWHQLTTEYTTDHSIWLENHHKSNAFATKHGHVYKHNCSSPLIRFYTASYAFFWQQKLHFNFMQTLTNHSEQYAEYLYLL